jgi:hypothetical protein
MMAYGMFFPVGETPYGAIPFYLIAGWAIAPVLHEGPAAALKSYEGLEVYFPRASSSAVAWPS